MKTKFFSFVVLAFLTFINFSCSSDDNATPAAINTSVFTATIGSESFSTNDVLLGQVSAGGTQGFIATGTNGKSFSSALFPSQFPIGVATNIAYSSSMSYRVGDDLYIPVSGTMTLTIMENYQHMKGSFSGVFQGGNPAQQLEISGEFDVSNP